MKQEDKYKEKGLYFTNSDFPVSAKSNDASKFFQNIECKYFPCHTGAELNCLFCFCPLYYMSDCGGDWTTVSGVKDCSQCTKTHTRDGYEYVMSKIKEHNDE